MSELAEYLAERESTLNDIEKSEMGNYFLYNHQSCLYELLPKKFIEVYEKNGQGESVEDTGNGAGGNDVL